MCGIAGFILTSSKLNSDIANINLSKMLKKIQHRGPDNEGKYIEIRNKTLIALGHRRLSIIDLSKNSNQPTYFENLIMTFNGEIYNYIEIRDILLSCGYNFKSTGDSEVLIKAFHKWGMSALDKLNGMFSISLFDKSIETLYLIRDRFGIKPLLYNHKNNCIYYASEVRSLCELDSIETTVSEYSVYEFMRFGYVSNPSTIFDEIKQVRPGCYLKIDTKNTSFKEVEYWSISNESEKYKNLTHLEIKTTLDTLMNSSVNLRLRSDVQNSIFLSGGIDSGLIAKYASQLNPNTAALTIGFDDKFLDESTAASDVAKNIGMNHEVYKPTLKDYINAIELLPEIWDRPLTDPSTIPTYILCKQASLNSKVVLSADGGDETFFGYNKHKVYKLYTLFKNKPFYLKKLLSLFPLKISSKFTPIRIAKKVSRLLNTDNEIERFAILSESIDDTQIENIFASDVKNYNDTYLYNQKIKLNRYDSVDFSIFDFNNFLTDDVMYKIDHAAMYNSIENREPMLDYRLVGFAHALPMSQKLELLKSKKILRNLYRAKKIGTKNSFGKKKGLVPPLMPIFRNHCNDQIIDYISQEMLSKHKFFNIKKVIKMRDSFLSGNDDMFKIIWSIFVFQKWYSKWGRL